MKNIFLKFRYKFFRRWLKPIKFGEPSWTSDFNKKEYRVSKDFLYAGHSYTSKDCVEVKDGNLILKCKGVEPFWKEHWSGEQVCYWKIGWVDYRDVFKQAYGTWEFDCILPGDAWPALWLLRHRHSPEEMRFKCEVEWLSSKKIRVIDPPKRIGVNWWLFHENNKFLAHISKVEGDILTLDRKCLTQPVTPIIGSDHIIPEVDVMEIMTNKKIRHTIHHGYVVHDYRLYDTGSDICKPHKKDYKFAVTCSPDKYEFFIDGIKTAEFKVGLSSYSMYPILNNAVHKNVYSGEVGDFVIKSMKYYSP